VSARPRLTTLYAIACALLAVAVWALAFHVGFAGRADGAIAQAFIRLQAPCTEQLARWLAALGGIVALALCGATAVATAICRGLPARAAGVAVLLVGANLTAQLLKVALAHPRYQSVLGPNQVGAESWPSGHATAAMSMVLATVMVTPKRWQPVVGGLGGVYAAGIAYAILLLDWHYPSDVIGGFLVALTWALLVSRGGLSAS
jgi:membrane-associated phospholipid phosphatase